jgi:hypothetical protein
MHILAIVSRDLEKGSTKYRLAQYLDFLAARGVSVEFVRRGEIDASTLEKARRADLLFNQKCLINCSLAKPLIAASRRVVFDFDDAIYTRPGKPFSLLTQWKVRRRFHLWLCRADVVTTANEFLAGYARRHSAAVEVVPMALDLKNWHPAPSGQREQVVIGWAGAPVNIPLLERLDGVLSSLFGKSSSVKLAVFSGQKPRLSCPFEYHPFRPGGESEFVRKLDIGLLPLADEEYARGKSPIKAIQYLASGVPVVGNVLGATGEILNAGNSIAVSTEIEWRQALEKLIVDRALARQLGRSGRLQIEKTHDFGKVAERLYQLLIGLPQE